MNLQLRMYWPLQKSKELQPIPFSEESKGKGLNSIVQ